MYVVFATSTSYHRIFFLNHHLQCRRDTPIRYRRVPYISISPDNDKIQLLNNCICSIDGRTLFSCLDDGTNAELIIPDGVTQIGDSAFFGCSFTKVIIPKGVTKIEPFAFSCCDIEQVDIPEGVTSIGERAFEFCAQLTDVSLPSTLTQLGFAPFTSCYALNEIVVSQDNERFLVQDGLLIDKDGMLYLALPNSVGISCSIPDGVTRIGDYAFELCSTMESVTIPDSVLWIGDDAFCETSLQTVIIPEGVEFVGEQTFAFCNLLAEVQFPESIRYIGRNIFLGNENVAVSAPEGSYAAEFAFEESY